MIFIDHQFPMGPCLFGLPRTPEIEFNSCSLLRGAPPIESPALASIPPGTIAPAAEEFYDHIYFIRANLIYTPYTYLYV